MKKAIFISSTGGHLTELLQLKEMFQRYDYHIITEDTKSTKWLKDAYPGRVDYLLNVTKHELITYFFGGIYNIIKSLILYIRLKPDFIISTGSHTAVPMCLFAHLFGGKIIYIETFANLETRSLAGRIVYRWADLFIVQWESMLKLYPKAVYGGWIF